MRLLLVEHDARLRSQCRQAACAVWPGTTVTGHPPDTGGPLPAGFLAQGFDAVLLGESWPGGAGVDWLQDLASRPGFAPILFIVDDLDSEVAHLARVYGAFGVLSRADVGTQRYIDVLREASRVRQSALADWRVSEAGRQSRQFGAVRIPGYRCIRRIPGGTVAQLYVAECEKLGSLVAVKVTPSMLDENGNDSAFERFLQEYDVGRQLRHPNIVLSHELGIADDHAYLVMEYFPDGDLRRRMQAGFSVEEALSIAIQITRALQALHQVGTFHRDLKPGNVLMRGPHRVALSDFGLAKRAALDLEITDPGVIFGTPHYMSPEQAHGESIDARSDLYSLGIILFEMLTGEKPFTDHNPMAILYKHRNSPVPKLPETQRLLQPLVERLLAKRPEDRFDGAREADKALYDLLLQVKGLAA
ncbi:MAG: hypothetical protein RLZZ200_3095 [Pseudomonadota bacterium]|jgi:hypothetical protein